MISLGKAVRSKRYDPFRLVDQRFFCKTSEGGNQIVCDIDKTYLETDIESILKLARTAFEGAKAKQTVAGAATVLHSVRWSTTRTCPQEIPLHFVSASPPQMRDVLSEKLSLDGLDWSSDTFKNQAYNLRRRRFDLLREQMVYKTLAILGIAKKFTSGTTLHFIGDNAESDPMIYTGVKHFLEGTLTVNDFMEYLVLFGVEKVIAEQVCSLMEPVPACKVGSIFIRKVQNVRPGATEHPLGKFVIYFANFFEVAGHFWQHDMLDDDELIRIARRFHNFHGIPLSELIRMWRTLPKANQDSLHSDILRGWQETPLPPQQQVEILPPDYLGQQSSEDILTLAREWASSTHGPGVG